MRNSYTFYSGIPQQRGYFEELELGRRILLK
jgi:hypothetical protein